MTVAGKIFRDCRVFAHCDVFIGNGLLFRKKKWLRGQGEYIEYIEYIEEILQGTSNQVEF